MKIDPETGVKVRVDLSGRRYGTSTVQDKFKRAPNGIATLWLVKCDCGNEWWCYAEVIKRQPKLCCKECRKVIQAKSRTTHGGRKTKAYQSHRNMMARCYSKNHKSYSGYGGRGIIVCDRWHTFVHFWSDMSDPPPGMTIERTNVNGNYEPSNCIWDTRENQANNRRNNIRITCFGKTMTISQWSRELEIDKSTILKRYDKGWLPEKCLSNQDFRY